MGEELKNQQEIHTSELAQDQGSGSSKAKNSGRKVSRRDFFKVVIGSTAAALIGKETVQGIEGKIETSNAVFYPFYEDHGVGVLLDTNLLPETLDIHWNEFGLYPSLDEEFPESSKPINEEWVESYKSRDTKQASQVAKDNLSYLQAHKVGVAFGDIEVYKSNDNSMDYSSTYGDAALGVGYLGLRGLLKTVGKVNKRAVI